MKIYNSFSRSKEEFIPIYKNQIKMYVCGQTVYDYCHLGHARKAVVFDMVRRWFIASGYKVTFVENITDIDDKIINRAIENNETITQLATRTIQYMHEDFAKLGIMPPDIEPKATQYIPQILNIINSLIKKGYAYQAENGDVYYRVRKFSNYGKLSGKKIEDLNVVNRVDLDIYKKDPLDFVLWKSVKKNEPYWESQFGDGRPGWHIECSAMSEELLGKTFDIHGGGQDLQFPHHENEIAQSEAHNGCKFANYWMHNGFLNINDEKMSKSLGNFFTLREVLQQYDAEVIRLFMLKTHYRSPLNFNTDNLDEAKSGITRLYMTLKPFDTTILISTIIDYTTDMKKYQDKFTEAMNDDFNTSLAISILFEICNVINKTNNIDLAKILIKLANSIGLLMRNANEFLQVGTKLKSIDIEALIFQRKQARLNKDFVMSDKIRDELLDKGIILEDSVVGTTWRKV